MEFEYLIANNITATKWNCFTVGKWYLQRLVPWRIRALVSGHLLLNYKMPVVPWDLQLMISKYHFGLTFCFHQWNILHDILDCINSRFRGVVDPTLCFVLLHYVIWALTRSHHCINDNTKNCCFRLMFLSLLKLQIIAVWDFWVVIKWKVPIKYAIHFLLKFLCFASNVWAVPPQLPLGLMKQWEKRTGLSARFSSTAKKFWKFLCLLHQLIFSPMVWNVNWKTKVWVTLM